MSELQALFLGIVQGLTELLPISSSGHLFILPWMFKWDNIPEYFDVALHAGTLLAIAIFFFKDWLNLLAGAYKQVIKKEKNSDGKMFFYLVIATIPSALIGFVLDKYFEDLLTKPLIIAIALIIMGILLYMFDKKFDSKVKYEDMNFKETFLIGMSQVLAFIPGVSRSGVTMTAARAMKIERESAARYSFMLSAPVVLGATILKFNSFVFDLPFIIGVLSSFIVGILVIKFLLQYLKNGSFKGFAIYRVLLGLFIILVYFFR